MVFGVDIEETCW